MPALDLRDVTSHPEWAALSARMSVQWGDAAVTGKDNQWATKSSVMLRVSDVDALCSRAQERGAIVVHPPQKHVYGEYQATLRDFAGHIWTLTHTVEDIDPTVWGGEAVEL